MVKRDRTREVQKLIDESLEKIARGEESGKTDFPRTPYILLCERCHACSPCQSWGEAMRRGKSERCPNCGYILTALLFDK